jgi:thiamine-monophosphate kinase
MTLHSQLGPGAEFDLIRTFRSNLPDHPDVLVGIGDDAAVLRGGWVVSIDASVEDVHFRRSWLNAEEIGYRAATVALSDLAAMAASPVALFVSLHLTAQDYARGPEIMTGIARAALAQDAAVAGGDTTRTSGPLAIDVAVLGRSDRPVLRSGARAGDDIWVTGRLGGAAAAVQTWHAQHQVSAAARAAFAQPHARVREALWLARQLELHALIDLSDGLASDAAHMAAASDVLIRLQADQLPIHDAARRSDDPVHLALTGGDDYELCFACAAGSVETVRADFERTFGLPLTRIGRAAAGTGVQIVAADGHPLTGEWRGYDHFGVTS